ncbi:MAG: adenosylmethionine decarboxylase [Chromatiales bacterium]|nr:adenosylmethionine decarboxylase [Chromatiales bacterium]
MSNNQVAPLYRKDYFTQLGDSEYAGKHILIDLWGAEKLDDRELLEKTLRESVEAAGATLLHLHIHQFTPTGGLSGTAILAESHINVHTWPERGFAAFDIFMCGNARPENVEPILKRAYRPAKSATELRYRGEIHKNTMKQG